MSKKGMQLAIYEQLIQCIWEEAQFYLGISSFYWKGNNGTNKEQHIR